MRVFALSVAAALVITTPALAQADPEAPPPPVQTGTVVVGEPSDEGGRRDPDAEVICRTIEETGSRLARRRQRVCATRTMWEQLEERSARELRNGNGNPAESMGGG